MSHTIEWKDNGVHIKYIGNLGAFELTEVDSEIYGNEMFERIKYMFYDLRDMTFIKDSDDDMMIPAAFDKTPAGWNRSLKQAFVVNTKEQLEIVEDYMEQIKDLPWKSAFFHDKEKALAWVNEPLY